MTPFIVERELWRTSYSTAEREEEGRVVFIQVHLLFRVTKLSKF